jgi:DNA-binding YbaB/EbfC family protein
MATEPGDDDAMPDMGSLLGMAMDMQQQLLAAQEQAASTLVEGQAGGGVVRIEVTGGLEFQAVHIDPAAVDPDDVEMLQDLVLAALHDAVARVNDLTQAANPLGGMDLGNLDLAGMGLGGLDLGGMLGTGGAEVLEVTEGDGDDDGDDLDDDEGSAPS